MPDMDGWVIFGFVGSALYFSRLMLQWLMSERAGRPVIPAVYWYLSVLGAAILTVYALRRQDPVFVLNYLVPLAIYIRQVVLHHRHAATAVAAQPGEETLKDPASEQ